MGESSRKGDVRLPLFPCSFHRNDHLTDLLLGAAESLHILDTE